MFLEKQKNKKTKKIFLFLFIFCLISTNTSFAVDTPASWTDRATSFFSGVAKSTVNLGSGTSDIWSAITGKKVVSPESGLCIVFQPISTIATATLTNKNVGIFACIYQILYVILTVASWVVSLFALVFDSIFELTVVNMKSFVEAIGIINIGWTAIRDMANILFIFMLLYLAIATILQLDEHGVKHGLSRLIIGATLINFSLFFVKIPIDVSNILAIEIYNKISFSSGGIGTAMMSSVNFQSVFTGSTLATESSVAQVLGSVIPGASLLTNSSVVDKEKSAIAFAASGSPITTFVMAIIMMATMTFVFMAVIIIFLKRLIALIMLMIFSPLAFAGMAIPNHNIEHEISSKFWGQLLKESFYAPAFMMIMYLGLTIINSSGFKTAIFNTSSGASFIAGTVNVGTVINFTIIIIILVFSLTVSEIIGVKGASGAIKFFDSARGATTGWVGRNTVGALAYNAIEKTSFGTNTLKQMRQGVLTAPKFLGGKKYQIPTWAGGGVVRGIGNMATQGLQKAGEGHHHDLEKDQAILKDTLNELRDDPKAQAEYVGMMMRGSSRMGGLLQPYNQKVAKYVGTAMKDDEVATMVQFMRDAGQGVEADTLVSYLGKERKTKVNEIIDNDVTRAHKIKMGDQADSLKLVSEYEKNRLAKGIGKITVTDSHGHSEEKTGDAALKHLQDNYGISAVPGGTKDKQEIDKGQVVDKIKGMFSGFSEKQKTGILSSLSAEQQKSLAHDKEFMGEMAKELTNYRMMEQTMKGGMNKELQDQLSKIAYRGLDRVMLYEALGKTKKDNPNYSKLIEAWKKVNEGIDNSEYDDGKVSKEMEELIKANKTFADAKQNFTRFAVEDGLHAEVENLVNLVKS